MKVLITLCALLLFTVNAWAAAPRLNFTDIDSGPKSGNTDGVGSGVIITVWGQNLGATQGTSKVYIGNVEATQVYYWKNADGALPGGPSELFSYHKMQEIAFSVPAGSVDGTNTIKIVTPDGDSNTLPFTVRAGGIYFVKSTGNDTTGNGSWSNPWLTMNNVVAGGNGKLVAGDTVYFVGVNSTTGLKIAGGAGLIGTAANPFSFIAYPNTRVNISGSSGNYVVDTWYESQNHTTGVNLSKLSITASGNGAVAPKAAVAMRTIPDCRYIGIEITGPTVYGGYGGAITNSSYGTQGGKFLGLYIHHFGYANGWPFDSNSATWTSPPYDGIAGVDCTNCTTVDRFQHLFYISNRSGTRVNAYEIGWGHFTDNPILEGLHVYDVGVGNGWIGTIKLHNNVVKNQRGGCIDLSYDDNSPIDIYNNLLLSDVGNPYTGPAIRDAGTGGSTIRIYNNTIVGYSEPSDSPTGSVHDYRNNIMVDNRGVAFISREPPIHSHNLFYSLVSTPQPTWASAETGNVIGNPLFANTATYDFSLQVGSPAISAGYNTTALAPYDFLGNVRSITPDLGAIGVGDGSGSDDVTTPTTTTNKPAGRYTATQSIILSCTDNVSCSTKFCYGIACNPTTPYSAPFPVLKNLAAQTYCVSSTDDTNTEVPKCYNLKKQRRR